MSNQERASLKREAEIQTKLLGNLSKWLRGIIMISSIGVVLAYIGLSAQGVLKVVGVLGLIVTIISVFAAFIINLAVRNGQRNVDEMIKILES